MHKDSKNFTGGQIFDQSANRAIIPTSEMSKDLDLKSLVDPPEMTDWIGPGLHSIGYCIICSQMHSSELTFHNLVMRSPHIGLSGRAYNVRVRG
jgi:hypothetical protein